MLSVSTNAGKLISKAVGFSNPASVALQGGLALQKSTQKQSIELFGYDFVSLVFKLVIYFVSAYAIAKFMEAVIFVRGSFVIIANLLGFNIPDAEQIPVQLKDLFSDEGFHGVKYWDVIKVVAILLVIVEYLRYVDVNSKNGGKTSPLTTGIFLLIGLGLSIITIPELVQQIKKLKNVDFNLEQLK